MKKLFNQKGITLIALIITVIVLLILAGTAISIAINGGDIFSKTEEARNSWNISVTTEEQNVNNVLSILNTMTAENEELTIPTGLTVGDMVTWTPSGTFEWNKDYFSDSDSEDNVTKTLYSGTQVPEGAVTSWTTSSNNIDMTISSWKVLSVDTTNNVVTLVPSAPTTAGVRLHGAQGYNNSVKLLNDACSSLYGNASGVTARSISMVDLEGTAGDESNGLMSADTSKITSAKTGNPAYGEKYTTTYTSFGTKHRSDGTDNNTAGAYLVNKTYPVIYEEEALREINNIYSATGLGMSEARSTFITRANSNVFKKTDATSIRPTKTYYSLSNSNFTEALGATNAELILSNGSSTRTYWVASRGISMLDSCGYFYVHAISGGALSGYWMFDSGDHTNDKALGLFPIVTLSSGILSGADHTYTYTPAS